MRLIELVALCGAVVAPPKAPTQVPPVGAPWPCEIAPLPHEPAPPISLAPIKGGYTISLNRSTAEKLRDALDPADEKQIASSLRDLAKEKRTGPKADEDTAATLELVAFVVANQLPGFKKAVRENMGPGGVIITMTGLQAPMIKFKKPRPRLEKALEVVRGTMPLLPDDAREAVETMRAVARTTPLFWKVEPRE